MVNRYVQQVTNKENCGGMGIQSGQTANDSSC